mgnify:FL=1
MDNDSEFFDPVRGDQFDVCDEFPWTINLSEGSHLCAINPPNLNNDTDIGVGYDRNPLNVGEAHPRRD